MRNNRVSEVSSGLNFLKNFAVLAQNKLRRLKFTFHLNLRTHLAHVITFFHCDSSKNTIQHPNLIKSTESTSYHKYYQNREIFKEVSW